MSTCVATVVAAALLGATGCGSGDEPGSTSDAGTTGAASDAGTTSATGEAGEAGESGDAGATAPPAAVQCPYGEFSTVYTPTDWVAGVASICHTGDGGAVLLVNDSAVLLDVGPGPGAGVSQAGANEPETFEDLTNLEAAGAFATPPGHAAVPPGGWVVVTGQPATVTVEVPAQAVVLAYATSKLVGYAEDRLAPDRARAQSVAGCAQDVATAWSLAQDPQASLTHLLADTLLGPTWSCSQLLDELDEVDPPPRATSALGERLARIGSVVEATVVDDVLRYVRNLARILP
ncbi:hypothetical protein [Nocardioides sp. GY 10113]|uniref:hypothetical protein n=1 Tax=Nocardioides sp. GY 10113 TaxID=2569761 RepID=UPI001458F030|nr:hypothetical protein [Nocardioides sp. GY 10113]